MIDRDPLLEWLIGTERMPDPEQREQDDLHREIDRLDTWLRTPPADKRREIPHVRGGFWTSRARLEAEDFWRVQDIYRQLVAAVGTGKSFVEESLLGLLARALDPQAVPFFVDMLDLAPPRDKWTTRRRQMALAALALLVYRRNDQTALAALVAATGHAHPTVRALALRNLRNIFVGVDDMASDAPAAPANDDDTLPLRMPLPAALVERLQRIATGDPAFEPRFTARSFLTEAGLPVPLDNPNGSYSFKITFRGAKRLMSRTIALRSEQTLLDLHQAIQHALKWGDDHLYTFFMNGTLYDEDFAFNSPWEEDAARHVDDVQIGALGLTRKHTFLYYFDYGDSHEFDVEVIAIDAQAAPGRYPRIVDSKGKAPTQYGWEDDEDDAE